MNIDWLSNETHVFTNPKAMPLKNINFNKIINEYSLNSHIILATSGSTALNASEIKFVALSKQAILNSSKAVNEHLQCNHNDVILNSLPYFHIGGLSLFSRSYLSGAKIINIYSDDLKWRPQYYIEELIKNKVTIASLVPTQIFDLVNLNFCAPKSLRAVVVGGGVLSKFLYDKAKKLNWPLLPSYGMTECASQIATAPLDFKWESSFPDLKILNHFNVKINSAGHFCISGKSLLTGYILVKNDFYNFVDVKEDIFNDGTKYLVTSDIGIVSHSHLQIFGRKDDVVKIAGENVSLLRLDDILFEIKSLFQLKDDFAIFSENDERLENKISIVFTNKYKDMSSLCDQIISEFNTRVFPFEKIKKKYYIENIPRTELGKLMRLKLKNNILYKD